MPQCHMCRRKVSIFNKNSRKLGPDKLLTCELCIPKWYQEEKERAITRLHENDDPVELFRIPEVKHPDVTNPQQPLTLYGTLIFTHKAVVFASSSEVREANPGVTMQFGLIGALIGHLTTSKRRKRAIEAVREVPTDLDGALQQAVRLILIPKQDITEIKYGWASGLKIKGRTRKDTKCFRLPDKRRTYEVFRPAMEEYVIAGKGPVDKWPDQA